ncbi:protein DETOXIFICATION 27-like isoform X1 [Cucurbita moschata]|uniref:Protein DETOXIFICATION n=1 Tax=Cucurbita moschata TaxID=3662 RepID=A0A6J1GFC0_CUCMO|nr:protein DETOXIFICATION 27-like isoform X1 [Cucurbita moschata]
MDEQQVNVPLLQDCSATLQPHNQDIVTRFWIESKKLWHIVGPSIFSRIVSYSILIIAQAFAGHLNDLDLAAFSIAVTVVIGFDMGLLMGMASALETLCGQAYGAKKYYMLGIYMQRSWIVLFLCCILLLPIFFFASPILKLIGEPHDLADLAGVLSIWMLPIHFSFAFYFPLQRFLQSQVKVWAIVWSAVAALVSHLVASWVLVVQLKMGVVGIAVACNVGWCAMPIVQIVYTTCGGCPLTWTGFSVEAFSGLWEFVKLSAASGVMLCLENWYYRILVVITGNMKNAEIMVDALSIWFFLSTTIFIFLFQFSLYSSGNEKNEKTGNYCDGSMSINGWEMMIPLGFFVGTGVRVANELGAGNGEGAKFATIVSSATSLIIGLVFCCLIVIFHNSFGLIFSPSAVVLQEVDKLTILLALTILFNSIQPVLSGVAVGSGWQSYVAYINLGCYYIIGLPLGIFMQWFTDLGVKGIWIGMIFGGTGIQTLILLLITIRCDWEGEAKKAGLRVEKWRDEKFEAKE